MKHLKTKLGLSVLALACLGAGVINLQPSFDAKAEETGSVEYVTDASGLVMTNGASVRVANGWSGMRWETTVKAGNYVNAQFGTLVAPTKDLGDDGILTHADESALDLKATGFTADATKDTKFYSAINYNNLADEGDIDLAQAYALELTARAYVKIDGEYHYADLTGKNTSRSARQVAIAAELDGALVGDQESAYKYYGNQKYVPTVKSIGAVGTPYIDLENTTKTVTATVAIEGDFQEAIIGAERVEAEYANGTLTITEANYIPTGEHYITIFTSKGVYTTPVIGATKVFDEMKDFEDFKYIRKNLKLNSSDDYKVYYEAMEKDPDGNKIDASKLVHDGYYVLAGNLEADDAETAKTYDPYDYTYESGATCAGYYGTRDFAGKELGLTGTFNGLGYFVSDYRIRRSYSGLFELINGGTIKNFYLKNAKAVAADSYRNAGGLAYYAIDPTLENVAITTTTNMFADKGHVAMSYYLYQTEENGSMLRNVYVKMNDAKNVDATERYTGGVFGILYGSSKGDLRWENVYVRNRYGLSVSWNSGTKDSETGITTYTMNYAYGQYGDQVNEDGSYKLNYWGATTLPANTATKNYEIAKAYCCYGVTVYNTVDTLKADTTKNISAFNDDPSNCWSWTAQDAANISFGGTKIEL